MKRRRTIQLDQVLREDQLTHLGQRAIEQGLAEIHGREDAYAKGKRRKKRRAPARLLTILEDLGMTLPAAATSLLREERAAQPVNKKPPSASTSDRGLKEKRSLTSKKS